MCDDGQGLPQIQVGMDGWGERERNDLARKEEMNHLRRPFLPTLPPVLRCVYALKKRKWTKEAFFLAGKSQRPCALSLSELRKEMGSRRRSSSLSLFSLGPPPSLLRFRGCCPYKFVAPRSFHCARAATLCAVATTSLAWYAWKIHFGCCCCCCHCHCMGDDGKKACAEKKNVESSLSLDVACETCWFRSRVEGLLTLCQLFFAAQFWTFDDVCRHRIN